MWAWLVGTCFSSQSFLHLHSSLLQMPLRLLHLLQLSLDHLEQVMVTPLVLTCTHLLSPALTCALCSLLNWFFLACLLVVLWSL